MVWELILSLIRMRTHIKPTWRREKTNWRFISILAFKMTNKARTKMYVNWLKLRRNAEAKKENSKDKTLC